MAKYCRVLYPACVTNEDAEEFYRMVEARAAFTRPGYSRPEATNRFAYHAAAENLLLKAVRVWDEDRVKAEAYVDHALRLPYDVEEEAAPAALEATMLLFNAIVDFLEDSYEDDSRWLDAAISAFEGASSEGRFVLRDVLRDISREYTDSASDRTRISHTIAGVPERPGLREMDFGQEELRKNVLAVVDCRARFDAELKALMEDGI